MGRKLDLSQLSDAEAKHVWTVVRRDLDLRKKEEQRLRGLKEEVWKQSTQREKLGGPPGEPHCACCLRPFRLLSAPPRQCQGCPLVTCEGCGCCQPEGQDWLCDPCHLASAGKTGSLDWFYSHLRARFRSFGSGKVIRSLSQCLRAGEPQPSSGERDEDGEQLAVDGEGDLGAQPQPPGSSTTKRRLSVHGLDEQLDSDDSTNSWGSLPSPRRDPGATGSPQPSAGEPSSEEATSQDTLVPEEANPWEAAGPADLEQVADTFTPTGQDVTLDPPGPPRIPAPEGAAARPGTAALSAECPPAPDLGELPSPDSHGTCGTHGAHGTAALRVAPQPAARGTQLAPDSQVPGLSCRLSAVDRLLTRLEHVVATSPAQGPADFATSEANLEEEALRMKLQQLTSHISDQGSSSEEDKEDGVQPGGAPILTEPPRGAPEGSPEAAQACGREWGPRGPGDSSWTTDQELSRLADRVATAASEVQQAKAEVSYIQSRIAALQAAGLTVRPSATPRRRRSNLPIFLPRLAGTLGQRPQDPCADSPEEGEVRPVSCLPRRAPSFVPRNPGADTDGFDRQSAYRGSLTQRNPNGRKGAVNHSFGKPVMAQQP